MPQWNGMEFVVEPLAEITEGETRYSVSLTEASEAERVDARGDYVAPEWPSDEIVSAWCGEPVQFIDAGDGRGFEAIYRRKG
jgi:hypothetical protein